MTKKTTLLQFFHWYYPDGGKLWQEAAERAPHLAELGITDPGCRPPTKVLPAVTPSVTTPTICSI